MLDGWRPSNKGEMVYLVGKQSLTFTHLQFKLFLSYHAYQHYAVAQENITCGVTITGTHNLVNIATALYYLRATNITTSQFAQELPRHLIFLCHLVSTVLTKIPGIGALRLAVQRKSECNVRRQSLPSFLNNYCASSSTFSGVPCQFRYPAPSETCVTVGERASMWSVKDSFDSDLESLHEISSKDVAKRNQEKKVSARENAIPNEFAGGFKKASELLRDIEAAKLEVEAGLDGKDNSKLTEASKTERQAKDISKSDVKSKPPRARKKKRPAASDAKTDETPTVHTSCYFPNDVTTKKHAQLGDTVLEAETRRAHAQDLLENGRKLQEKEYSFKPTENCSLGLSPAVVNDELGFGSDVDMLIAVDGRKKFKAIEDEHNGLPSSDHLLVTTNLTSISPARMAIDLTTNPSLVEADQDSASNMASVIKKYSYTAQDSTTSVSYRQAELYTDQKTNQSTATKHVLDGAILNKAVSPVKKKSPVKKRQLTVTEKALFEFRPEEVADSRPLQEYFLVTSPKKQADETKKKSRDKPRTKITGQTRKPEKKSSLLAPVDALQTLHDQQLMFGTSSQLLQHSSSPNHPQNQTIHEPSAPTPNLERDDSFIDIDFFLGNSSNLLGLKSTRSLWSAATQDGDGEGTFMNVEAAEAIDESEKLVTVPEPSIMLPEPTSKSEVQDHKFNSEEANKLVISVPLDVSEQLPPIVKSIPILPRSLGEASTKQRQTSKPPAKKKRKIKNLVVKPEDAFKEVALADLKAELKNFGCKPPRSRAKMVELILECRAKPNKPQEESRAEALQSQSIPEPEPQVPMATSPNTLSHPDINLDPTATEEAPVPDPPRPKRKRTHKLEKKVTTEPSSDISSVPPPSFQIPPEEEEQDERCEQQQQQQQLDKMELKAVMSGIHQAIMTQPPTHSITNPSWKEKIAIYDPIVLEELTAWLNTGALDAVGIGTEVWPALVRDWCESKSVCFIWTTEGWRKKNKKKKRS